MDKSEISAGSIYKTARIESHTATEEDMKLINKYTLTKLTAEDVFVFKCIAADNETDDRNFMPFSLNALQDMKKLYVGKTMIKDHAHKTENQIARVYATELIQNSSKTVKNGEFYTQLAVKCYMVRTKSNADLIAEISAGIKREVSTYTVPARAVCNICGEDNVKKYCSHWQGRTYKKDGKDTVCLMTIDGCKEAYELSFVAVPAQPRAATYKSFGNKVEFAPEKSEENQSGSLEAEVNAKIKLCELAVNEMEE